MIWSIRIEGFRRFDVLEVENLGRINVIMGSNNCGKTTVLEAIHLLTSQASTEALAQTLWRRNGTVTPFRRVNQTNYKSSVWPLFHGNARDVDTTFGLSSQSLNSEARLTARVSDRLQSEYDKIQSMDFEDSSMALLLDGDPEPVVTAIPIDCSGNVTKRALDWSGRRQLNHLKNNPKSISLTSSALNAFDLVSMWDDIVLTPDEERVIRILASLDDGIDRIVAQFSGESQSNSGPDHVGFVVKYNGLSSLLPFESFGSGAWRLLSLAVAITHCRNGTLLVDEIDTGLDATAQSIMWRALLSAVYDLNVQVFATTHDIECINILAKEALDAPSRLDVAPSAVFHRIESGREKAVRFKPIQILIAEKHSLEVR